MNNSRRKAIKSLMKKLETMIELQYAISEELEAIKDEEQDALDNMPESLLKGERGQQMQEYIDEMESVIDDLDQLDIEDFVNRLEELD